MASPNTPNPLLCRALGRRIDDRRRRLQMTKEQLSDASGVPLYHLESILDGTAINPGIVYVDRISRALAVPISELY